MGLLADVQYGKENVFGYIDNKTAIAQALVPGIDLNANYQTVNMTSQELFKRMHDKNDEYYYYWYGKVKGTLRSDVHPSNYLWVSIEDQHDFGLYMWLSSSDTRPPIHYDQDHNFYVHVSGIKRFFLFPPWENKNMHPFPRIHPRWHKSQCSFDSPNFTKTPNFKNAKAYEAILFPGEVLYIPPYWWHHVQAITASVSLASWSRSGTHAAMKLLYERKAEFDKMEGEDKKLAVYTFIEALAENIYGKENTFVRDLLEARWLPLRDVFENLSSFSDSSLCNFKQQKTDKEVELRRILQEDVDFAVRQFESVQGDVPVNYRDVRAIRDLEVQDFVEIIAADAFGAEGVYAFFSRCFS
eukprot:TRINITY_DN8442_c0_g1_i1.p1 TRINITY_DN8442_c0_g1~~TRINITY_DN8442_c0_g1_i1.p1  ORF type:complete len:355 (+),score=70.53 TRINITY_DN8442_c0_g1_i1:403-1467(+)